MTPIHALSIGGTLPENLSKLISERLTSYVGSPASQENIKRIEKDAIEVARSEHFSSALITTSYQENAGKTDVYVECEAGLPLVITLTGNKTYTQKELLKAAKFYSQRTPFGDLIAQTLAKRITDIYHKVGFLSSSVVYSCNNNLVENSCVIEISEGVESRIEEVKTDFDTSKFNEQTKEQILAKGPADPDALQQRAKLSEGELAKLGYINPKVSLDTSSELSPGRHLLMLRASYESVKVYDALEVRKQDGFPFGLPKQPEVLSDSNLSDYVAALHSLAKTKGYPDVVISRSSILKTAVLNVQLGEPARIGAIEISGNRRIPTETIALLTKLKPGETWNEDRIADARRALTRYGAFSVAILESKNRVAAGTGNILLVHVQERGIRDLKIGGGYDSVYGVRGTLEGSDRSLFTGGSELRAFSDLYYDPTQSQISRGGLSLSYVDPFLFQTNTRFSETLSYLRSTRTVQEFELSRTSLSTLFERTFHNGLRLAGGHLFFDDDLFNVSPDAQLSKLDSGNVFLSMLSATAALDKTDSPLNPKNGYRFSLDSKLSSAAIGSEANFFSLLPKASLLLPLSDSPFSLQFNASGGVARDFAGTSQIPITQRFYLGGTGSVRGFKQNSLGPRGTQGSVLGGDTFFAGTSQVNYFFTPELDVHTFLDVGQLRLLNQKSDAVRKSTGFGVRYAAPVGPISFDVGIPLNRVNGAAPFQIHFSLGASF